jgi:anti-anti-sigma factor
MCCHRQKNDLGSEASSAPGTPLGDPVPLLNVALVPAHDQVIVRLTGEADLSTVPLLADALAQAAGLGTRDLVVDVAAARFWDSSALRALATISSELGGAGRGCRIVGAGPATRRLIRVADLTDSLELDGPIGDHSPTVRPDPQRRSARDAAPLHHRG